VCINGDIPRRNGCKMGQVFNDVSKTCDWPRNVPEWWVQRNSAGIRGVDLPGTNTFNMGTGLTESATTWTVWVSNPGRGKSFLSLLQNVRTETSAHAAYCSMAIGGYFPGGKADGAWR
jgi:hypothetical protein